jgi:hypothetical protein
VSDTGQGGRWCGKHQRKVRAAQSGVPGVNPGQRRPAPLTVQIGALDNPA